MLDAEDRMPGSWGSAGRGWHWRTPDVEGWGRAEPCVRSQGQSESCPTSADRAYAGSGFDFFLLWNCCSLALTSEKSPTLE